MTDYLTTEDVAKQLRRSTRAIHALTASGAIPHRRIGGTRRCLFIADEIDAWLNGADLETIDAPHGGRVIRPKAA